MLANQGFRKVAVTCGRQRCGPNGTPNKHCMSVFSKVCQSDTAHSGGLEDSSAFKQFNGQPFKKKNGCRCLRFSGRGKLEETGEECRFSWVEPRGAGMIFREQRHETAVLSSTKRQ
ncbi:unnamed protein product [Dibothriocephalus latus]|uniref:Uncharacterized protein n=1 Tax=Dibothriocephalus latus TaxID=60516 RepID=A0A3P6TR54_DIBLA|nr:unnamed protein product [Dibothriocephalus latus]